MSELVRYDGAAVLSTTHDSDTGSNSNPLFTNGAGVLQSVRIEDGRPRR